MSGFIFDLCKYVLADEKNIYKYLMENNESFKNFLEDSFITFGEFDRMTVTKVIDFTRFRDVSEDRKNWFGENQSVLIYEIGKNYNVDYKGKFFSYKENGNWKKSDELFIGLTILQFGNNRKQKIKNMSQYLESCRLSILSFIYEEKKKEIPLVCEVYGTLGNLGIAILWLTDQYTEVLRLVNLLKVNNMDYGEENKFFLSAFTIFFKNKVDETIHKNKIEAISGKTLIEIAIKTNINFELLESFDKDVQVHCAGKDDITILIDTNKIYSSFNNKKIFDENEKFSLFNVLSTNSKLCSTIDETYKRKSKNETFLNLCNDCIVESKEDYLDKEKKFIEKLNNIIENYENLRKQIENIFPKTAGMVDTMDSLNCDFKTQVTFASNEMWKEDFAYQYQTIISCLNRFLSSNINKVHKLKIIKDILNNFKQQIFHISESNNLFIDIPKCHLRYTGKNNLILYAYFGMIKSIIELAYKLQDKDKQSEIIPLIIADVVPMIGSELYINYNESSDSRLITLNLPMTALYDLPRHSVYLYHELFHYIVPSDRYKRNFLYTCLSLMQYLMFFIKCFMLNKTNISEKEEHPTAVDVYKKIIKKTFLKKIYNFVIKHMKDMKEELFKFENLDENIWNRFEEKLFKYLGECLICKDENKYKKNIVYLFLLDVYADKESLLKEFKKAYDVEKKEEINFSIEYIKTNFEEKINTLKNIKNNQKDLFHNQYFKDLLQDINIPIQYLIKEAKIMIQALQEVSTDIAMIDLSEMSIEQYLITYTKIQKDILIDVSSSSKREQDILRLGIIIDYILGNEEFVNKNKEKLKNSEQSYINLYIGYYFCSSYQNQEDFSKVIEEGKKWFDLFIEIYNRYYIEYRIYIAIINELFNMISLKKRNNQEYKAFIQQYKKMYFQNYMKIIDNYAVDLKKAIENNLPIDNLKTDMERKIFDLNILLIQIFQDQKTFSALNKIRKKWGDNRQPNKQPNKQPSKYFSINSLKYDEEKEPNDKDRKPNDKCGILIPECIYKVDKVSQFSTTINKLSSSLLNRDIGINQKNGEYLWYRGHSSVEYNLIPSIMREFKLKKHMFDSLDRYQRAEYEEFKFRADGSPEILEKSNYSLSDYLALMQHYSVPTNYLDWSEDALTSLYFALESFIESDGGEIKNTDAVLYIFNPSFYNEVRNKIIERCANQNTDKSEIFLDIMKTKVTTGGTLPNLSISYNEQIYNMFLLGNVKYGQDYSMNEKKIEQLTWEKESAYLPIAVYTSRLNPRIRSQSGMFLAFNIYTPPSEGINYEYMDLEKIQEFYLREFREEDPKPFLYKIVIVSKARKQIADWIKSMGVSKEKIYPELHNIGQRVKR